MWRDTSLAPASNLGGTVKKVSSCMSMSPGSLLLVTSISTLTASVVPLGSPGGPFAHILATQCGSGDAPALMQTTVTTIGAPMSSTPPTKNNTRQSSSAK